MTAVDDEVTTGETVGEATLQRPPARPKRIRRIAMRPRRAIVKTHRWLSFALMAWLIVIGLTGAWLVVNDAVESWIHSDRYATTPGDIGMQAANDAVAAVVPEGAEIYYVQTRRNSRGVYQVGVEVPADPAAAAPPEDEPEPEGATATDEAATEAVPEPEYRYFTYYVDPGSGKINGVADQEAGATNWLYRGHMYLWQDHGIFGVFAAGGWCSSTMTGAEPGGIRGVLCDVTPDGEDMVAWFAVGWLVVLFTGFYLWYWPGVRRWATALVIKRKRGAFAFNMSVHKVVGLIVWLPLTAIAFTGIAFAFPNLDKWYENATPAKRDFSLWTPPEDAVSAEADGRPPLTLDQVMDTVGERYPERAVQGITAPTDETGTFSLWVTRGFDPWTREGGAGNVYLLLDQYTGETVYDGIPGEGNVFDQAWDDYSFPVHTGDVGGTVTRVIWVLFGLSPLVLMVTGVAMNVIRRGKRRKARERDAVPASA